MCRCGRWRGRGGEAGSGLRANSNRRLLDDPQASFELRPLKTSEKPPYDGKNVVASLRPKSKHYDARVVAGRVRPKVREVLVKCDDRTALSKTDSGDLGVLGPTESLVENRERIMTGASKQECHFRGQVLVELEPHR